MRKDIVNFLRDANRQFRGLEAWYVPTDDLYIVAKNGKAVSNFTSTLFYRLPKYYRMREWRGIINQGLAHNMGESTVRTEQRRNLGIKIKL